MELTCFECQALIEAETLDSLGVTLVEHARGEHDWPYPDRGIRNYAEATQRLTGPSERLEEIGGIEVYPVTEDRIDDWLEFFDHDAFVGKPEWAACYCLEPFTDDPSAPETEDAPHWRENRERMIELLRAGTAFGYLAYVDGRPAGWVNASKRSVQRKYSDVDPKGPDSEDVVGVSCFMIAPPYRRHGLAETLLDRVLADAAERGAKFVEAYPFNEGPTDDADGFRGPRRMFERHSFEPVEIRTRDTVVRRIAPGESA